MTLEHKVAQMFMVTLHGAGMTDVGAEFLRRYQPGGVVLFASNVTSPQQGTQLTNDFQRTITEAGGPPLLIGIDQEGGVVQRLTEGFTTIPVPYVTTAAGEDMAFRMGELVGQELAAIGVNMNFAPVADLETNLDNPIIDRRAYSNDPQIGGQAVSAVVRGLQSVNVLATVKHFPGHGETSTDSHGALPRIDISRERLNTVELEPFRQAIANDVAAVMVGHLWLPSIDPVRRAATLSPVIMTDLLRDELGFEGLIVTDAMDMNAVDMEVYFSEAMVQSVEAGVDLMTMGPSYSIDLAAEGIQAVVAAVESGRIPEARIDDSVRRILAMKERFGILDWQPLDPATAPERVDLEGHALVIDELYQKAVTVAYDRNDLLPLRPEQNITMVFLGTRYQIQTECQQYNPNIRWLSVSDNPDAQLISWAAQMGQESDVVVVWTQNADKNPDQQALVNALPPEKTVAVAIWSAYDWRSYPGIAAYVATYSPARQAVPAACAVLFGALPANGQLSMTLSPELPAGSHAQ